MLNKIFIQLKYGASSIKKISGRNLCLLVMYVLCGLFNVSAQDSIHIIGHLKNNTRYSKVVVMSFDVGLTDIVAVPISNNNFKVAIPPGSTPGVYRLQYGQEAMDKYIDVIVNGTEKNIEFTFDVLGENAFPVFHQSEENKTWYLYLAASHTLQEQLLLLNGFISNYPEKKAVIVQQAIIAMKELKEKYEKLFKNFAKLHKNTWAGAMVLNRPLRFTNPLENQQIQEYMLQQSYWEGIDTHNPALINTPLYTEHTLNYLQYFLNTKKQLNSEEQVHGYKNFVDTIMNRFSGNIETEKFAYQYLVLGFKEIDQEEIVHYLDEKYGSIIAQCKDEAEGAALAARMVAYEALKEGNEAPNIAIPQQTVNNLKDLDASYKLIVFGASGCPACQADLPVINEQYQTWKDKFNLEVVYVSIDTDLKEFEKQYSTAPFITLCDGKGWETKAAKDYYVYATPTYVLVNRELKIQKKFVHVDKVNEWFEKWGNIK